MFELLTITQMIFHTGVPYMVVSLVFLGLTIYGLKVLLDIRKELRKK